jgi:terminase, large subunit
MDMSPIHAAIARGLQTLEAVAPMRLSEHAGKHFYLSAESSYVEGTWKAYPYQIAILDAVGNDDIEEVDLMKSARVGYTKIITAAVSYFAHHKKRNQALWQPTDEDSDDFCKTELEPMLRDVPVMASVFPYLNSRCKENTLKQKKFLGSVLHLRGGKAAKNYRRITIDTAYLDEIDGFDLNIEKEGSPIKLAWKRTEGATFRKMIIGSTPKLKGFSHVEARYDSAEQRFKRLTTCPHCGELAPLTWGGKEKNHGFKWVGKDADSVQHLQPCCGAFISQAQYLAAWEQGRWQSDDGIYIDDATGKFYAADNSLSTTPRHVAFHVWTAYSPQVSWAQIVREFLEATAKAKVGDSADLQAFVNTTLGETWEEKFEKADEHALMARAEPYALRTVPMGGLIVLTGVDVQDDRFEITSYAFGRGEESWVIDHTVLYANPAEQNEWDEKLAPYLDTVFSHACGTMLKPHAMAVDTGGHFTHQAYNFCRDYRHRRVYAVRGDPLPGKPIGGRAAPVDVNYKGKVIARGIKLWHVGTDTAKDLIFGRLRVTSVGPGYMHFSKDLAPEFYHQLTSEVRMPVKTARGEVYRWLKPSGKRNEALDCTVYVLFLSHRCNLHKMSGAMWDRLQEAVQPANHDLFAPVVGVPPAPVVAAITESAPRGRRVRSQGVSR